MKTFQLGQKLREERARLGFSAEEVGFLSGVSRNHIGQIERGEKMPRIDTAEKIAKALNKELDEILSSISSTQNSTNIEKIAPYLNEMTDKQFEYILKFIKDYFAHYKTSKTN